MEQNKGLEWTFTFARIGEANFRGHGVNVILKRTPDAPHPFELHTDASSVPIELTASPRVFTFEHQYMHGIGIIRDSDLSITVNVKSEHPIQSVYEYHTDLWTLNVQSLFENVLQASHPHQWHTA
jgi:hypothetical protein